jgi:hypothetical protein
MVVSLRLPSRALSHSLVEITVARAVQIAVPES